MTRSISARIGKLREALGSDRDEALALRNNGAIRKAQRVTRIDPTHAVDDRGAG
jgi:hypothetical protein